MVDAAGRIWLRKVYKAKATEQSYLASPENKDPFQDLYNALANDLAAFKDELSPADIQRIRTIATLRFAGDFAPHTFAGYLVEDQKGRFTLNRLPARDKMTGRVNGNGFQFIPDGSLERIDFSNPLDLITLSTENNPHQLYHILVVFEVYDSFTYLFHFHLGFIKPWNSGTK